MFVSRGPTVYPLLIILSKYRKDFYYFWSNPTITRVFWFKLLAMDPCFQVIVKDSQRIFSFVAGQSSCSWWRRIKPTSLISDTLRTNCGRGKNRDAALGWKPPLPAGVTRHHLACIELDDTGNNLYVWTDPQVTFVFAICCRNISTKRKRFCDVSKTGSLDSDRKLFV